MKEMLLKRIEELTRANFVHEVNLFNLLMWLKGGRENLCLIQADEGHGKLVGELVERLEDVRRLQEIAGCPKKRKGLNFVK